MSGSFPVVPLGDVLTKSAERIDLNPDERYRQVTVRLWGKGVVLRDEVNGVDIGASKRFVVRSQQFILSRIDARNGAFGLVPDYLDGAVVSSDFPAFTVDPLQITPEFLEWMSKTHFFVELCKSASEGTTNRVRLKEDRFLANKIPLPSLEEQRHIVAHIEELAAKIDEARGLRQLAVEEAEKILHNELNKIFYNLSQNHQIISLKILGNLLSGGTPSKSNYTYWNGEIPFVTGADITDFWVTKGRAFLTNEGINSGKTAICNKGTVLIVSRTRVGRVGIASRLMGASQDITPFICNKLVLPEYITWFLMSISEKLIIR